MLGILNMFHVKASSHVGEPLRLLKKKHLTNILLHLKSLFPHCPSTSTPGTYIG